MRYILVIISALLLFEIASAETLVMYHKDSAHQHFYDKSSVFFPSNAMGSSSLNKSLVDVWEIRRNFATGTIVKTEKLIDCTTRRITAKNIIDNGKPVYSREAYKTVPIKYDSADYHLYKEMCINMKYR